MADTDETLFQSLGLVKAALTLAEQAHPGSPELKVLHNAMSRAVTSHGATAGLSTGEVKALLAAGGTPK